MSLYSFCGFSFSHILLLLCSDCLRGANPSIDSQRLWLMSKQEVFPQSNAQRWQDVCSLTLCLSLCIVTGSAYTNKPRVFSRITCLFIRRKLGGKQHVSLTKYCRLQPSECVFHVPRRLAPIETLMWNRSSFTESVPSVTCEHTCKSTKHLL